MGTEVLGTGFFLPSNVEASPSLPLAGLGGAQAEMGGSLRAYSHHRTNCEGSQPGSGCVNSLVSYQMKSRAKFTQACLMIGFLALHFPARLGRMPFASMAGTKTTPEPN